MTQKKYRAVNLANCKEVGRGQCSSVYRTGDDRVVKLFFNSISDENIKREVAKTMEGNHLSINAAKCYGLVTYDCRIGMELEFINGTTVQQAIIDTPELLADYAEKTALQLRKIHTSRPNPKLFPDVRDFYIHCIRGCEEDKFISNDESLKLERFVFQVPHCPTMVHGDYHIMNIMQESGKIRLIDLADCMTGHPIYDLLVFHLYMKVIPVSNPDLCKKLVGIPPDELIKFNDIFIRTYFDIQDTNKASFDKVEKILDIYSLLKLMLAPYSFSNVPVEESSKFVEIGRSLLMPVIEENTGIIPENIMDLAKI